MLNLLQSLMSKMKNEQRSESLSNNWICKRKIESVRVVCIKLEKEVAKSLSKRSVVETNGAPVVDLYHTLTMLLLGQSAYYPIERRKSHAPHFAMMESCLSPIRLCVVAKSVKTSALPEMHYIVLTKHISETSTGKVMQ